MIPVKYAFEGLDKFKATHAENGMIVDMLVSVLAIPEGALDKPEGLNLYIDGMVADCRSLIETWVDNVSKECTRT